MFRTPAGQARYFAAYAATLALWPVPVEALTVPTRYGPTHVNACGPASAPGLLLLPGQAISATMWYPNIGALSQAYRVYAPDIPGDMGQSVSERRFSRPSDFGEWLTDLLDGLGLAQTHVAGLSYGGFIALRLALGAPGRVRRLVLMAPASLQPLRWQFFARMAAMVMPSRWLAAADKQRLLLGVYSPLTEPAIRQMLTPTDMRYSMYLPPVTTDAELRQVQAPTLLLWGDHEVAYNPHTGLRRAQRHIPHLETELVPGAGHALTFDAPDWVNARLLAFLRAADA